MAEKILKIKLVADTSGATSVLKEFEKQNQTEREYQKLLQQKKDLFEQLQATIANQNSFIEKGIQNQGLAWYNAERALAKYANSVAPLASRLKELKTELDKINSGTNLLASSAKTDTRGYTRNSQGTVGENRLREQEALNAAALSRFSSFLSEQEKRLAASIDRQKAIQIHGINSIEARKVQAAENERRLQTQLQQNLENLRTKISAGTISPSLANAEARRHLQVYRQAILDTNKALLEQEQAHERAQNSFSRLAGRIFEIIGIYRVYNFVLNSITNSIKAIPNIGIQLEATKAVLEVTEKSTNGMLVTLDALTKEAKRTGIQIGTIRESFRTFSASASLAGESGEDIWRMFTNINTVSAALHLTTDQTNHVFLALAQIFNKTKVQSEELVKQLGNLLPGAFASFAKANENAFKNTADLVSKMKAGVVDAHSTMLRFTQFMADRFAVAFLSASHGLNFALNNMKTSFTLLGEAIYGSTSGGLITASKLLGSFADIIRKDIEGLNILGETIKTVLILGLSAGIVKLVSVVKGLFVVKGAMAALTTQMTATQFALGRLQAAFAFLSSPTAIIAGIGLLISKFYELRTARIQALEESDKVAEGLAKALERQKLPESQRAEFDVENAPEVVAQKKTLESLQKTQKAIRDIIGGIPKKGDLFFEFWDNYARKIEQTKNNIQELKKVAKEQVEANSLTTAPDSLAAVEEAKKLARIEKLGAIGTPEALKEQATLQKTKQLQNEMNALERDTARANEEIEKLLASAKGNPEQKQALIEELRKRVQENEQAQKDFQFAISNAGNKKTQTGLKTQFREEYKEIIRDTQDFVREIENKVFQLENAFELRQVPIEEYFVKKQELITQSFNEQIAAMQEAANKAFSNKDLAKGNEYSHKVKDLEQQKYKEIENLGKQLILTQEAYNNVLSQTNSKFLKIVGNAKQAAEIDFNLQHAEDYKQFLQEGNQEYLQKLDFLERDYEFQQSIAELEQQRANINSNYEAQLQNINALYNVGSITQIDSLFRTSELNRKRIIELEEIIQKEEKILQLHAQNNQFQGNGPLLIYMNPDTSGLQQAKRELEQLRIEGNAVANFFRQTFTNSFKESFADIITGQKDVKTGFKDLLSSIIEEMAGFIADAIVKQFFSLMAQMFQSLASSSSSAGGGIFGSLFELFVGAAASSKGNIISNNNIVPFAKGGIPDVGNKMQYFPLANGGIGSLRENNKYEAILPLHRDASGSLGVKANTIGPQAAGNVYNISVHVQSGKEDKASDVGDKVAEAIVRRIAREEAGKMQRNTSYANKNQKFG